MAEQAYSPQRALAHCTLLSLFTLVPKTSGQIPRPFTVESKKYFQVRKDEMTEVGVNLLIFGFGWKPEFPLDSHWLLLGLGLWEFELTLGCSGRSSQKSSRITYWSKNSQLYTVPEIQLWVSQQTGSLAPTSKPPHFLSGVSALQKVGNTSHEGFWVAVMLWHPKSRQFS